MLYDPKWEKQTEQKADPFTLVALISWIEGQPREKVYCFTDNGECLLAQYFSFCGYKKINMGPTDFHHGDRIPGKERPTVILPRKFNDIAGELPRTFGAALERARAALR